MSLKFCANLSFMFQEITSLLDRYVAAKVAGFKAVECANPYAYTLEEVIRIKDSTGLEQILINVPAGSELGFAAKPDKVNEFLDSFHLSLTYAKALNCKIVHIMSGLVPYRGRLYDLTYEENLKTIIPHLESEGIIGVIEPINSNTVPKYYLNNYERAIDIIKKLNSPNLKLLLDLFHLQQIKGDLSNNILQLLPYVGHIQIAQVPNRHEPDTDGEINYDHILNLIKDEGYSGWIGLEYTPLNSTVEGLTWLKKYGYDL